MIIYVCGSRHQKKSLEIEVLDRIITQIPLNILQQKSDNTWTSLDVSISNI